MDGQPRNVLLSDEYTPTERYENPKRSLKQEKKIMFLRSIFPENVVYLFKKVNICSRVLNEIEGGKKSDEMSVHVKDRRI